MYRTPLLVVLVAALVVLSTVVLLAPWRGERVVDSPTERRQVVPNPPTTPPKTPVTPDVVPIPPDWKPGENCDAPRTGPCPKPLY
jgi:hypothetical protein